MDRISPAHFHHCPRCGARQPAPPTGNHFACVACSFRYYFNPACATAVFIERDDGTVLFIRRAKDPAKGTLAPPGGFVDFGETAEASVRREVREEVGLGLTDIAFLCSAPNEYACHEVVYRVLDMFFTARSVAPERAQALDDVTGFVWLRPDDVPGDELAFPSMRVAWKSYLAALRKVPASRPAP